MANATQAIDSMAPGCMSQGMSASVICPPPPPIAKHCRGPTAGHSHSLACIPPHFSECRTSSLLEVLEVLEVEGAPPYVSPMLSFVALAVLCCMSCMTLGALAHGPLNPPPDPGSHCIQWNSQVLREMVGVLQCYTSDTLTMDPCSFHQAVTIMCLNRVLSNPEFASDITFEQFVCQVPMCEWLSQRHRIEAYIRQVLIDLESPPTELFPDWNMKNHLVSRYAVWKVRKHVHSIFFWHEGPSPETALRC